MGQNEHDDAGGETPKKKWTIGDVRRARERGEPIPPEIEEQERKLGEAFKNSEMGKSLAAMQRQAAKVMSEIGVIAPIKPPATDRFEMSIAPPPPADERTVRGLRALLDLQEQTAVTQAQEIQRLGARIDDGLRDLGVKVDDGTSWAKKIGAAVIIVALVGAAISVLLPHYWSSAESRPQSDPAASPVATPTTIGPTSTGFLRYEMARDSS